MPGRYRLHRRGFQYPCRRWQRRGCRQSCNTPMQSLGLKPAYRRIRDQGSGIKKLYKEIAGFEFLFLNFFRICFFSEHFFRNFCLIFFYFKKNIFSSDLCFQNFFFFRILFWICPDFFWSFWHQRIYDTSFGSQHIAVWIFCDRGGGIDILIFWINCLIFWYFDILDKLIDILIFWINWLIFSSLLVSSFGKVIEWTNNDQKMCKPGKLKNKNSNPAISLYNFFIPDPWSLILL
jgi:hypothetical protein